MAIVKATNSKGSIGKILDYVMNREKTTEKIITGINCSSVTAYEQMTFTKEFHNKTDGIQYYHIMQSFKPFEVNAEIAHKIGVELAKMIAPEYEIIVATHTDKEHMHNHIVINSVHRETGKKFKSSIKHLWDIKRESNRLCERENLSTIDFEKKAKERLTSAELRIQLRGGECWKEDLRQVINKTKTEVTSLTEMQTVLKQKYNVEMKIQNKNLSFLHPDKQKYCRGIKLGYAYTKEVLESGFTRGQGQDERDATGLESDEYGTSEFKISTGEHTNNGGANRQDTSGVFGVGKNNIGDQRSEHETALFKLQELSSTAGQELSDGFGAIDTVKQSSSGTTNRNSEKIQPNNTGKNFDDRNNSDNKRSRNTGFNYVGKASYKVRYTYKYKKGIQLKYVSLIKLIANLIVGGKKPARKFDTKKPYNKENDYDVTQLTMQLLFINKENIKNENELIAKYNESNKALNETKAAIKKSAQLSKNLNNVIVNSEIYFKLKKKESLTSSEKTELERAVPVIERYKIKGETDLNKLRTAYQKTSEELKTLKKGCEPIEMRLTKVKQVIDTYESIKNDSYLKLIQLPNRQSRDREL